MSRLLMEPFSSSCRCSICALVEARPDGSCDQRVLAEARRRRRDGVTATVGPRTGAAAAVAQLRVGRDRCFAVVVFGAAAVLMGDLAPAPVGQRAGGDDPERLDRVEPLLANGAQVRRVVAPYRTCRAAARPA